MNRLTLSACRPIIARVLGVSTVDTRVRDYLNEAQERLMQKGKWVGSVVRYRFCASSACITMPRHIETIEGWALCDTPMTVRDKWYEFVGTGPGQQRGDLGSPTQLIDRGTAVTFNDISGANSFINVVNSITEAVGMRILLRGYDYNNEWIRTIDAGALIDGEFVTPSTAGVRTVNKFISITGVVKPSTSGNVTLSEWPAALGGDLQTLAEYEPDETVPLYRRYLIPNLADEPACSNAQDACDAKTVTVLAKLRHIPVVGENDFLILGNLSAFKLAVQAILKEERNLWAEAQSYWASAVQSLQEELSSFEGDGVVPVLRVQSDGIFGGAVENPISYPFV